MTHPLAFFSFVELEDATQHRAYNEWHQLDHRPENLALPGVAWGDRWGRPGSHRSAGTAAPAYAGVDYVAMYWFREPVAESLAAWERLGEDSFQWGRGPLLPGVRRRLLSFFVPVKGYAAASARVSADALPYRPNRGIHLTLTRYAEPHGADAHSQFAWQDRTLVPALLDVNGVAGAWTFSFHHHQRQLPPGTVTDKPASLRIRLVYLDGEPLETTAAMAAAEQRLGAQRQGAPAPGCEEVLLASPLHTIIPWQDW